MENLKEIASDKWYNTDSAFEEKPSLFDNQISRKKKFSFGLLDLADRILNRVEQVCILLGHDYFNEIEAAKFLRIPDPCNVGRETVRNYAIRWKKISYHKVGRNGLIFHRADLENFLKNQKTESLYESSFL